MSYSNISLSTEGTLSTLSQELRSKRGKNKHNTAHNKLCFPIQDENIPLWDNRKKTELRIIDLGSDSRQGFLSLGPTDTWVWIILRWQRLPCALQDIEQYPWPLPTTCQWPPTCQGWQRQCRGYRQLFPGGRVTLTENHCFRQSAALLGATAYSSIKMKLVLFASWSKELLHSHKLCKLWIVT